MRCFKVKNKAYINISYLLYLEVALTLHPIYNKNSFLIEYKLAKRPKTNQVQSNITPNSMNENDEKC